MLELAFRVGPADADVLSQEFYPEFSALDLLRLPNYQVYVKLMVDGAVTSPFSAETIAFEASPPRCTSWLA